METGTRAPGVAGCAAADDLFLRFVHWAERAPHRRAISDGEETWSYAGLLSEVGRLGHLLPAARLGQPSVVAVLRAQGAPTVVGMLAALARGHGVVGLEAGRSPKQRLARLEAVRPDYVLTNRDLEGFIPDSLAGAVFLADDAPALSVASWVPRRNALLGLAFDQAPTGRLEVHAVTHRMISAEVDWAVRETKLSQLDHLDGHFESESENFLPILFRALATGAQLSLVPFSVQNSDAHARWTMLRGITFSTLTATSWRNLLSGLKPGEKLASVRFLEMNGERFHPRDIALIRQHLSPGAIVQNTIRHPLMGTFMSARCRAWQVSVNTLLTMEPVREKGVTLEPVEPCSDEGEVVLHTDLRSHGHWLGATLSHLQSPDPAVPVRTGCIGRMLDNGRIRFLGRCEDYVIIQEKRVNLRQIERWISLQPGVAESVVTAVSEFGRKPELAAFVVFRRGGLSSPESLRRAALLELGEAQRPMHWVPMASFPRQLSGAPDLFALAHYLRSQREPGSRREPDAMDWLRAVWERILGHGDFGVHDAFFGMGGDAQAANELVAALRKKSRLPVTSDLLWEHSTLAEQAVWLDVHAHRPSSVLPVLREADALGRVILVPPFGCGPDIFHNLTAHLALGRTVHCLNYAGWPALPACASAETLGAHAAHSILAQWPQTALCLVGYGAGSRVAWETAQFLRRNGNLEAKVVLIDAPSPREKHGWARWAASLSATTSLHFWRHGRIRVAKRQGLEGRLADEVTIAAAGRDMLSQENAAELSRALKAILAST